jgi:tetratricopeptide (TPR) repeat protein
MSQNESKDPCFYNLVKVTTSESIQVLEMVSRAACLSFFLLPATCGNPSRFFLTSVTSIALQPYAEKRPKMATPLQWQPGSGSDSEEPMYFQSLPLYLPSSNLGPLYVDFYTMPTSNLEHLYGSFNTMPSSDIDGRSLEGHPAQMISNRIKIVPDALPVTNMIPISTADMLPVSQKVPTSADWDFYRSTIIRLYRDEDRTLNDVVQIMRIQHHFHATAKMYKIRLAAWDVRKYMTRAEREVACRVMKLNQRTGEISGKVIVRGKERNPNVFLRHMGQSRVGIRRRQLLQSSKRLENIIVDSVKTKQFHSQIWPTIYPAGPQRNVEIICKETLSLVLTSMVHSIRPPREIYNLLLVTRDRFHTNRLADVRVLLNRAASWFFDTVCSQPAEAVLALLKSQSLNRAEEMYASDLLACFHRHLLDLVRERYGPQHSLTKLLMQIFQIENNFETKQQVYQSTYTAIISNLELEGKADLSSWYGDLADSLVSSGKYQQAEGLLLEAVKSFDGQTHGRNFDWVRPNSKLAWHYIEYKLDMHDEAERMLNDILEAGREGDTGELDPYHAYYAYWGFGALAEKREEEDTAINFYRLKIQVALKKWGADSPQGLSAISNLEDYLRYLGREEEAVEVDSLMNLTDEFSELGFG